MKSVISTIETWLRRQHQGALEPEDGLTERERAKEIELRQGIRDVQQAVVATHRLPNATALPAPSMTSRDSGTDTSRPGKGSQEQGVLPSLRHTNITEPTPAKRLSS